MSVGEKEYSTSGAIGLVSTPGLERIEWEPRNPAGGHMSGTIDGCEEGGPGREAHYGQNMGTVWYRTVFTSRTSGDNRNKGGSVGKPLKDTPGPPVLSLLTFEKKIALSGRSSGITAATEETSQEADANPSGNMNYRVSRRTTWLPVDEVRYSSRRKVQGLCRRSCGWTEPRTPSFPSERAPCSS